VRVPQKKSYGKSKGGKKTLNFFWGRKYWAGSAMDERVGGKAGIKNPGGPFGDGPSLLEKY
jgi:hypothetical protein